MKTKNCCKNYLWLLWDGVGFFGATDLKLDRLKGIKPRWYDPFKNKRWMTLNLIVFLMVTIILKQSFETLGNIKSQEITKEYQKLYTFNINEQIPLVGVMYYEMKSLIDQINQNRTDKMPYAFKDMSKEQLQHVRNFVCKETKI
jgi:hypothetical protein